MTRRLKLLFAIIVFGSLLTAIGCMSLAIVRLHYEAACLDTQIAIVLQIEKQAYASNSAHALVQALKDVIMLSPRNYDNSHADRCIHAVKSNAAENIIYRLRTLTGKDFGDDPNRWLNEYNMEKRPN